MKIVGKFIKRINTVGENDAKNSKILPIRDRTKRVHSISLVITLRPTTLVLCKIHASRSLRHSPDSCASRVLN